jgi:hypothetical protein
MIKKILSTGFCVLVLALTATAQMIPVEKTLKLGLTDVKVRIYTKKLPNKPITKTFVVVHHNEQKGLTAVKEVITKLTEGGRLVEVVSNDADGDPQRFLHFNFGNQTNLCIDPNRMYSLAGIRKFYREDYPNEEGCNQISPNTVGTDAGINEVFRFGQEMMKIVTLNNTHRFIVGVHNNDDNTGLSVKWWMEGGNEAKTAVGVFLTNKSDDDDFIMVSTPELFTKVFSLINNGFSLALQKKGSDLTDALDDGSMSIYFGRKNIKYIIIETAGKPAVVDAHKQRQIEAVAFVNKL